MCTQRRILMLIFLDIYSEAHKGECFSVPWPCFSTLVCRSLGELLPDSRYCPWTLVKTCRWRNFQNQNPQRNLDEGTVRIRTDRETWMKKLGWITGVGCLCGIITIKSAASRNVSVVPCLPWYLCHINIHSLSFIFALHPGSVPTGSITQPLT